MYCEGCGADNAPGARFCLSCGAVLAMRCPHCGSELPAGARFCPSCGQAIMPATPAESSPRFAGGERKQVTVLFADFSGFTAFSDKLDAEEVHDYMNSLWTRLDEVVAAYGGMTEKHMGDAIMALLGAGQ